MAEPFKDIPDARKLAQAIVDTVREPLLVLDKDLHVMAASRSFYQSFQLDPQNVEGRSLFTLSDGEWDIPALRVCMATILGDGVAMGPFQVEHEFSVVGRRVMLLNARKVFYENGADNNILLAFEDVTERRVIEFEKDELLRHSNELLEERNVLFQEMQHRVANSLQIIASILMLKARSVTSQETRAHLEDAHQRVLSVAAVQDYLRVSGRADLIELCAYLTKLCDSLAASMIGKDRPIAIQVLCERGTAPSATAVSLGLIVTELVINAVKYAFPVDKPDGRILVSYELDGSDWNLVVSDNGVGRVEDSIVPAATGLGTSLVKALAHQLDAVVAVASSPAGMNISVTHATFTSKRAAA